MNARAIALLYHDVIDGGDPDASGFSGSNAAEYKLSRDEFRSHLIAIRETLKSAVIGVHELDGWQEEQSPPVLMSFDDGGVSAVEHVAPMLEEIGWKGCFFITTDYIDKPAFLTRAHIRDLHARGHIIGSHSCSHPPKISDCKRVQLLDEWRRSLQVLQEILGEPVTVASIPGGFYSREIVDTAYESGVRILFTSEPVQKVRQVGGCTVIGRFSVKCGDDSRVPAEFVEGDRLRRLRHYAYWNIKKAAKALSGPVYPWVRTVYLARKRRH